MTGGALDAATERRLRDLAPRVLGALARRERDFDAAEDAVQEALLAAAVHWPSQGVPDNPGGWLYRTALRWLADRADAERARHRRERAVAAATPEATTPVPDFDDPAAADDTLPLLFLCCHPALTPPSAIALTLRAVGGLTTAAIARAFLVPEATVAQRIGRAKQTIADAGATFAQPDAREREARLGAVLHVLYLMYNEGHTSSEGEALQTPSLAREAIRLARLAQRLARNDAETDGLLALLLLTDARAAARTGPHGELVPLHEQDRTRWDRAAIAEGTALAQAAFARGRVGAYQLQAAIAALHDNAPSVAATDWTQIEALYGVLARLADNPMVLLNRAVATAMVHGPDCGLQALEALAGDARLAQGHRLDAVRAHLHEMAGRRELALQHFRAAALRTANVAECQYLLAKAAALTEPGAPRP